MYYLTEYGKHWENTIGDYYKIYNDFYRAVRGAVITGHTVFNRGVNVLVEYSNGVSVYINYGNNIWEIDGLRVGPLSFEVI
jgi:hypothetical protein